MDCQWATLGWNQKKVGAWPLIIRFSDGSIFKLFIKSEMHKLFINRAKGAKVEPDIKYIKKMVSDSTSMHSNERWLERIKSSLEPKWRVYTVTTCSDRKSSEENININNIFNKNWSLL